MLRLSELRLYQTLNPCIQPPHGRVTEADSLEFISLSICGLGYSSQLPTCPRRTLHLPQACPQSASQSAAREEVSGPASCLQVALHPAPPGSGSQAGPAGLVFGPLAWYLMIRSIESNLQKAVIFVSTITLYCSYLCRWQSALAVF